MVAKGPWTGESEARLVRFAEGFRIAEEARSAGREFFLEVSVARDEVLSRPVAFAENQKIAAVTEYAENDAFPQWRNSPVSK